MKTRRKCPNCQMNTLKEISTGISYRQWYIDYECEQCKKIHCFRVNKRSAGSYRYQPAKVKTEFSVRSTELTPIGINEKDWPDNG